MKEKKNSRISILVSVVLHIAVLIFLLVQETKKNEIVKKDLEINWVELQNLPTDLDKNAQIVQQDEKSINEKTPEKDYKLSKNNQDVLKETKAEKNGEFQNKKNQNEGMQQAATPPAPKEKPADQKPKKQASTTSAKQKLFNALTPSLYDNQFSDSKLAPPPRPALSGAEVSQSDDYLKDVVSGAETLLKTREFVYYAYYNRIKRKLRQHWEPRIQEKIVKILRKGRRIASVNDKITHLVITLDKQGELKRIQVKHASGYNDLDDAAIEAFRAAAPFPNPPDGIVSKSGEVQIPWSFVLET